MAVFGEGCQVFAGNIFDLTSVWRGRAGDPVAGATQYLSQKIPPRRGEPGRRAVSPIGILEPRERADIPNVQDLG